MLSKLFFSGALLLAIPVIFPFLLNVLISHCSSSAKIKVKKVPKIIYRRKIGVGDDNYDLSRCSLRMHNNLRKWEKKRFIKKRENHPKFNTANQQISSGKDIKFERHQYFSAVTKLLFMLMRQLDLCMCVHNLFLTTDVIIKAVQDFWFSLCTIFRGDLDIMVKSLWQVHKSKKCRLLRQWNFTTAKQRKLSWLYNYLVFPIAIKETTQNNWR